MNKIKKSGGILLLFTLFALGSCVSVRTLTIDFPRPSAKELPGSIQSLALVARVNNEKFSDLSADSLQKILFEKEFTIDTVLYDLHMADTTLQALGKLLFESGRYDYVIPEKRFITYPDKSQFAPILSWDTVTLICETFNTDAVLSLDHIAARLTTTYENKSYYDPYMNSFYALAAAEMKISYEATFRVYDPENQQILLREFIRDTLIWEDSDASPRTLFQRFTPVKQAFAESGIEIALNLADKISVKWHVQRRKFFVKGNSKMRHAAGLAIANDWMAAMAIWKEIGEKTRSRSLKSKALLNTALAYEMLGDIDQAVSWALKSYDTQFRPLTYEYLEILKMRRRELKNQSR
jgi:tetratricopeptide (TPR) repeat protein